MKYHAVGLASNTLVNYRNLPFSDATYLQENTFLGIDSLFSFTLTFMSFNDINQSPGSTMTVGTAKNTHFLRIHIHYFNADRPTLPYSAVR